MVTKFDVGDVISFEVIGRIKNYSCSEYGDWYTIELIKAKDRNRLPYCIDSEQLEECHAVKIDLINENENNETRKEQTW